MITGPPGFGKTACLEDFMREYRTYYDAVVFLRCSDVFEWLVSLTKMVSLYGLRNERYFHEQLGLLQCEEFEINARRLYKAELEPTLAKELSGRKTVLVACDDVQESCVHNLSRFVQSITGSSVHLLITTQLSRIRNLDHFSIEAAKLSIEELDDYFSIRSRCEPSAGARVRMPSTRSSTVHVDVLDSHPAACGLARDYLLKTKSGIWGLKPQYHGIWAEHYFTYGKDKFTQWLEKSDLTDLRSYLAQGQLTSLEDIAKADSSAIEGLVPQADVPRLAEALRSLTKELDDERLNVMIHLNLSTASRAANSILNMLSVVGDDWFEYDVLLHSWMKNNKDESDETAKHALDSLEKLGLVHLNRSRVDDAVLAVRVPRCFQKSILNRLTKEKQTSYKKIVQCVAFYLSRRLPVHKVWSFDAKDAALFTHALAVARHSKRASLFTISARNIIAFARELVYVYGLAAEAKQFSEHLLKMEQLVPENVFSVCREKIRVQLSHIDIFDQPLTDSLLLEILSIITRNLSEAKLYRLAVVYLEKEIEILRRHPERLADLSSQRVALAQAYGATGREREATALFQSFSESDQLVVNDLMRRKILFGRAESQETAEEYVQAKASYTELLKMVEARSDEHARVLLRLGDVSAKAGHHLDAFGFYSRLMGADEETRLPRDVKLKTQFGIALSLKNQGDLQDSLNAYQTLHAFARDYDDGDYQIVALVGQGDVYTAARMLDSALRLYEQSLQVCEIKKPTHRDRSSILNKIGHCQRSRGNLVAAKETYENCVSLSAHVNDKRTEASALSNIAKIYQQMGDVPAALRYFREQLKIATELKDDVMMGVANGSIGNCYSSLRKYDDALAHLTAAVNIAEKIGDQADLARSYSNLGNVYQMSKKYSEAEKHFRVSIKLAVETNDIVNEARARGNLGNALHSQSRFGEAVELYERTIELSSMSRPGDKISEGNAYHNRGCALEGLGDVEKARDSFEKAIAIFDELYQQTGASESFRPIYRQLNSKSYRRLQFVLGELGDKMRALEISERSRGLQFVEIVAKRFSLSGVRPLIDSYEKITRDEIIDLVKRQNAWVLIYSICRTSLHAWVVSPQGDVNFRATKIADDPQSESRLDKKIRSTVAELTNYENLNRLPGENEERIKMPDLSDLSNFLIRPIEEWLPTRSVDLVVIPAGLITLVPFSALPCGKDNLMMSQIYRIRSIPALIEFERWRDDSGDVMLTDSLIVGNPDVPSMHIPGQSEPWRPVTLPNAEREAIDVARLVNGHPLVRKEATKRRVTRELPQAQLIHLATHGGQGGTTLFLAPEEEEKARVRPGNLIDSKCCLLTCDEIEGMDLRAQLVCLSSCGSARGEPNNDGVMGLARSFLIAGARMVLVTLWQVPDRATEHLMYFFYRNMLRGAPASFALQQSMHQLRCLEQFAHPVHWAGFQIIGPDISLEFPASFNVRCVPDCQFFTGMESELNELSQWVLNKDKGLLVRYVRGIQPGIGKTTLIAEFLKIFNAHYSHIFWVRGHSNLMLLDGFCAIASIPAVSMKEGLIISHLHSYLRELDNWLLIIDGIWEGFEVDAYLPKATSAGRVIIIADDNDTNMPSTPENVYSEMRVGLLEQDETIVSLLRRTSTTVKPMSLTDKDRKALKQFTRKPFYLSLPLCLELAGSFIRRSHIPFHQFLDMLLSRPTISRKAYDSSSPTSVKQGSVEESSDLPASSSSSSSSSSSDQARQTASPVSPIPISMEVAKFIVSLIRESLSDSALKFLACFVSSGSRILPINLLRDMVREREKSLDGASEDDVTELTFNACLAEVVAASVLRKHSDGVVVKHSSMERVHEGSTALSAHPVVLDCLQTNFDVVQSQMFITWASVFDSELQREGNEQKNVTFTQAISFCRYVSGQRLPEDEEAQVTASTELLIFTICTEAVKYPPAFAKCCLLMKSPNPFTKL